MVSSGQPFTAAAPAYRNAEYTAGKHVIAKGKIQNGLSANTVFLGQPA